MSENNKDVMGKEIISFADNENALYCDIRNKEIHQYDYIFFNLYLKGVQTENPNPNINIEAHFTYPTSKKVVIPAFLYSTNDEYIKWQVRFTPVELGCYKYYFKIKVNQKEYVSNKYDLKVKESNKNGFLHLDDNFYFLKFDSGQKFRGLGINFAWEDSNNDKYSYEFMYNKLSELGGNFTRTWMCPKNLSLEWDNIGEYNLEEAKRLDKVLALAEKYGIYIMLTFDYHGVMQTEPDYWGANDEWKNNPYNVKNGGPCKEPKVFFTNRKAKKMYKKRLKYIVARWGYSPHIAVWEFWNEIDHVMERANVPSKDIVDWHQEMAKYLKKIDPYNHLISTSISFREISGLWNIQEIDFTQLHYYDPTDQIPEKIYGHLKYDKPCIVGEFGYDWKAPSNVGEHNKFEKELHLGLWRGIFSPTPVLPLSWWWQHHESRDDLSHIKSASKLLQIMMNTGVNIEELKIENQKNPEIRCMQVNKDIFIWIYNNSQANINKFDINIPGIDNKSFKIKEYNTYNGEFIINDNIEWDQENNRLELRNFNKNRDKVYWLNHND